MTIFLSLLFRLSCCLTCWLSLLLILPLSNASLSLSPSCPSCPPICFGGQQLGTGRRMLPEEAASPVSQESYKRWTKNKLFPENSLLCLRDGAALLSCGILSSLWGTAHLSAAGLRPLVRITRVPVIESCLIWKSIGVFYFPDRVLWRKSLSYLLSTFIQMYWMLLLFLKWMSEALQKQVFFPLDI